MELASRVVVISRPERIVARLVGWVRGLQRWGRIREFEKVKLTGLGNLIDEGLGNNSLWTKSDSGLAL